ncbi:DUF2461 family protein [Oceanihabitans sp. IOP_32]|uniref:DUF2461 family protein n=1 Tax=Oceanihabitans sp. IOP_32 TaxID=2529032 RepID=UPI00293BC194|nr:DUF2461 family protein [Oceanihabitans sp. IOP_32]
MVYCCFCYGGFCGCIRLYSFDLIKKKQYIFIKKFSDKEVLDSKFIDTVNESFKVVRPFLDYMSDVLTTDLNGVSLID